MESAADFVFEPLPPIEEPATPPAAGAPPIVEAAAADPLGPLAGLAGNWAGQGFNVIWRPHPLKPSGQDRFLELNVTSEQLDFGPALRNIPNRGLLQPNISLAGLNYLQQISDANLNAPQHFEPGLWVTVPGTSDPQEPRTVARMASIPHGTTILLQGTAQTAAGAPTIPDVSIKPFGIGHPAQTIDFPEQTLATVTQFRTGATGLTGVTQQMVNNPNTVLRVAPPQIATTTTLHVSSRDAAVPGGGTANIAFLTGTKDGPNAVAARVTATFWLETLQGRHRTPPAAVLTARAAELQRPQLASRHGRHAQQAALTPAPPILEIDPTVPARSPQRRAGRSSCLTLAWPSGRSTRLPGWRMGCRVGIRRLTNSAISAMMASTDRDARSPSMRAFAFSSTMASAVFGGTPALSSAALQVLVGDERDASGQLDLRLGGDIFGDVGVVLDAGEERRGQRRDEHRAGQRGADRRAEVGHRCSGRRRPRRSARRAPTRRSRCRAGRPARRCRGRRAASARSRSRARHRRRARPS